VDLSHTAAAFGLGVALGAIPGPVQLLIVSESARSGPRGGLLVMAGANGTFGVLLLLLAAGLSSFTPGEVFLRSVKAAGGAFLLFLAADGLRSSWRPVDQGSPAPRLHPSTRGILAVLLNPGAYLFLATTASALLAGAAVEGGRALAFVTAGAMLLGVFLIDAGMMLLGTGTRRALRASAIRFLGVALSLVLLALGILYLFQGLTG
jgi:threonine/homoserine/homoserine lactone efflux protein